MTSGDARHGLNPLGLPRPVARPLFQARVGCRFPDATVEMAQPPHPRACAVTACPLESRPVDATGALPLPARSRGERHRQQAQADRPTWAE